MDNPQSSDMQRQAVTAREASRTAALEGALNLAHEVLTDDHDEALYDAACRVVMERDALFGKLHAIRKVFKDGYLPPIPGENEMLRHKAVVKLRELLGAK